MAYKKKDNTTIENIEYEETILSNKGETFEIKDVWMPQVQSWSAVYNNLEQPYNFANFTTPRLPIDLGAWDINNTKTIPKILRCTIKPINSNTVYLPQELAPLKNFIQTFLQYEKMISKYFYENEVHITVDTQLIKKGETQRFPGWHVDGLQGGKFKDKLRPEHSYIISNNTPTEFCLQPFFIQQYDEDITNFFKTFDQQAKEINVYQGLENHVYLMDAYIVHRTPVMKQDTERSFVRLTVANAPLPIEYNTLNPMLKQTKPAEKLDIRDWLREPDQPINYQLYSLDKTVVKDNKETKGIKQDTGVFEEPSLTTGETITITQRNYPIVNPTSPLYTDILEPFNSYKYTTPRLPIDIGKTNINNIQKTPNVLRMPIKWWDSNEILLPKELLPIKTLISRIMHYDKTINPMFEENLVHITHDSRVIKPGATHRYPGWHGDDLQGGSFDKKLTACHSYIVTSNPGTEFCLQPFFISHLTDSYESLFKEFGKQANNDNVYTTLPDHVYLVDPYMVHRTPVDKYSGKRTFLRITFSVPELLLPGNTINPMFENRQKEYEELPYAHEFETFFTVTSDKRIPYSMYGLQK